MSHVSDFKLTQLGGPHNSKGCSSFDDIMDRTENDETKGGIHGPTVREINIAARRSGRAAIRKEERITDRVEGRLSQRRAKRDDAEGGAPDQTTEGVQADTQVPPINPGSGDTSITTKKGISMAISTDPTGVGESDANQDALEDRFIALYERLMEKQISFKEAVEPFKTDNQNAGKG